MNDKLNKDMETLKKNEAFDVSELDDKDLDDVAGGGNTNCGCVVGCSKEQL